MLSAAVSKVMWVGRATVLPVVVAVMLVLVFGASPASAHKGYKGLLHLGHQNVIAKVTTLVGKVATGSSLVVKNPSGGSALGLQVKAGKAPLTVNAEAGKATNLDADKVDGKNSSAFAGTGMSHYAGSTSSLEGCSEKVLLSSEISPSRPALIYASGVSVYNPSGGAQGGNLQLELRDDTETTTLASGGNMYANGGGNAVPLSAQGVLMSGSDVYTPSTPFEVTPGNSYVLRLVGNATDGCSGSTGNYGSMEYVSLSYLLIGK